MSEPHSSRPALGGVSARAMEIVVAVILFGIGSLVVYDSHRLGSSWGSDGPQAGYFPFYIGLIICISSAAVFIQNVFGKSGRRAGIFVEWQPLRQVLAMLLPAALYVLGTQLIGLYVASAVYIALFMRVLGKYGWLKSVSLGFTVSALAFITFEVWFKVPLYKGAFDPLWFLGY
ncbi:MAG TPA: tripartite tricarboxylate transporter TctB family protein [Burkholderiales bacterium]|nr:tripartite tricarboxylate transporter TctB family protein [Burkholderiales bacterium]